MATNQYEDDFDDLEDTPAPQDDSALLKQLRKQLRDRDKQIKEISEKFESLSRVEKERVVKNVLEAKGVNQKAARFIMKDLEDINDETVNRWLDDNGELFGIKKQAAEQDPQKQIDLAALRQQDIVTQGALSPDKSMDALQRINDAASAEEIINMIQSGNF